MKFNNLLDFLRYFKDDKTCIEYYSNIVYENGVYCPYCDNKKVYKCKDIRGHKQIYKCPTCNKKFHCLINTFFENTKLPIQKWFVCMFLIGTSSKGISSTQLSRQAGITQKTAWTVLHKIRNSFGSTSGLFSGMVEIDETYVGGKEKNKHDNKKIPHSQGGSNKEVVFGALERGEHKKVIAKHLPNNKPSTINKAMLNTIARGSELLTDENKSYKLLSSVYDIYSCNHSKKRYVVDGIVHNNNMENFWSIFKRGYVGIYHWMSKKHLQKYLNEYTFRYNNRDNGFGYNLNMILSNSKRLTYKELISG